MSFPGTQPCVQQQSASRYRGSSGGKSSLATLQEAPLSEKQVLGPCPAQCQPCWPRLFSHHLHPDPNEGNIELQLAGSQILPVPGDGSQGFLPALLSHLISPITILGLTCQVIKQLALRTPALQSLKNRMGHPPHWNSPSQLASSSLLVSPQSQMPSNQLSCFIHLGKKPEQTSKQGNGATHLHVAHAFWGTSD